MAKRAQLILRLLGQRMAGRLTAPPRSGAAVVSIASQKARALLYFAAMQKRSCATRGELATLLWGDRTDALARQSLRQCLALLRGSLAAIAPELMIADGDVIALRSDCLAVDVREFEQLAASQDPAQLQRAGALYGGEFLSGEAAPAPAFSEWVDQERMRLQTLASRVFAERARQCDARREGEQAIEAALRLTGLDPLREDWQRLLLQMYARYRSREAALAHARTVVALLRRELAVEPAAATKQLIAAIERGELGNEAAAAGSSTGTEESGPLPAEPAPPRLVPCIRSGSFAKPSIAVLPFAVIGTGCDASFFAEGLRIEIVSALSHIRALAVLARDSGLGAAGEAVENTELDVDYSVEGSIRQTDARLRVTIALSERKSGYHVFCRSFDAVPGDAFAAQDEIAANFSALVEPAVYAVEGRRALAQPLDALDARACVMRALALVNLRSRRNYALAQKLLRRAIELSPDCAQAYGLIAYVSALEVVYGWKSRGRTMPGAQQAALDSVLRDTEEAWAHFALGFVHAQSRATEPSIECFRKAIALNPGFSLAYTYLGSALSHLGRTEEALEQIERAEKLSPREFFFGVNNYVRANAFFAAGKHDLASAFAMKSVNDSPGIVTSHRHVVVNDALRGEIAAAKAALRRLRKLVPSLSLKSIEEALPYSREGDKVRFLDAFYRVGIK